MNQINIETIYKKIKINKHWNNAENQITPPKTMNNTTPHSNGEITKKKKKTRKRKYW
jgi:hypothetical protein